MTPFHKIIAGNVTVLVLVVCIALVASYKDQIVKIFPWENPESINKPASDGDTPLHNAAWAGDLTEVKRLLSKGARVHVRNLYGKTPLHYAAEKGHREIVKLLVNQGADVNAKDCEGNTPRM